MLKVAVVILNWNGEKFLEKFLPSVIANSNLEGVEIFIADNGSTDGSLNVLESKFPSVKTIRFYKNHGFATGYNLALKQIESKYYVLLNSDVEVTNDWLLPLISIMDSNPRIGACMPKILDYHNQTKFEYAGAAGGFIDYLGYPFCRGRVLSVVEEDSAQYDSDIEVFWASGACMFVRSSAYWEAGGLDDDFFAHMEEIDLCWRMKNLGYSNWCIPKSKVYHVGGGTLPNNNPRKLYLNYRNSLYMLFKNLPKNKLYLLFFRMTLDGFSAAAYAINGKLSFFKAVLYSHIDFWKSLSKFKKKRFQRQVHLNGSNVLDRMLIIQFFLKKKRKFVDIMP